MIKDFFIVALFNASNAEAEVLRTSLALANIFYKRWSKSEKCTKLTSSSSHEAVCKKAVHLLSDNIHFLKTIGERSGSLLPQRPLVQTSLHSTRRARKEKTLLYTSVQFCVYNRNCIQANSPQFCVHSM